MKKGTWQVKTVLAQMLKSGMIIVKATSRFQNTAIIAEVSKNLSEATLSLGYKANH